MTIYGDHEYVLVTYEQDGTTIATEVHYLFYDGVFHQRKTAASLDGYATEQYVSDGLDGKQDKCMWPGNNEFTNVASGIDFNQMHTA